MLKPKVVLLGKEVDEAGVGNAELSVVSGTSVLVTRPGPVLDSVLDSSVD